MEPSRLAGGLVRRLWPADMPAFRDHLLRLDAASRRDRFGMAVTGAFLADYAERCFGIDDVIYGFLVDGAVRGAGELRGIGHNLPLGLGGSAEAAFSVETGWRRRGIGAELMARILRAARNRRAETLYMTCLATNEAMMGLARKFTSDLRREPDEARGSLSPRGPDMGTLIAEAADDMASFATALVDLQRRAFGLRPAGFGRI
jgi:GNAT superfamily N-acetyltransferase